MIEAYILLNLKPGKENELFNIVPSVEGVQIIETKILYGEYDGIIRVRADTLEELRKFVVEDLRKREFIENTHTLIVAP